MDIVLRPITPADLAAVHALERRVETHDAIPIATPLEEFEEWCDDPHLDLAADTRLVEFEGRVLGWARVWHRPSPVREARTYLMGAVDPAQRGHGLGSVLLAWQIGRSRALLRAAAGSLPRYVRAQAYDFEHARLRLFGRHGMRVVRYMDELLRPLDDVPPLVPVEGVRIVPWDAARSDESRLAQNAAFADHWGSVPRDPQTWAHELSAHGSRPDLSFMALADGQVVGVCRNAHFPGDEATLGRRDGWVTHVSTIRAFRGRGIASALVSHSLAAFRGAGLTHAALGVDSENVTGAYAIYERLGFRPIHRAEVWQIEG